MSFPGFVLKEKTTGSCQDGNCPKELMWIGKPETAKSRPRSSFQFLVVKRFDSHFGTWDPAVLLDADLSTFHFPHKFSFNKNICGSKVNQLRASTTRGIHAAGNQMTLGHTPVIIKDDWMSLPVAPGEVVEVYWQMVSLLLSGPMEADQWLHKVSANRHMWPLQMTSHSAANQLTTEIFMRRERRRLQARHIWKSIQPDWPMIKQRVWTKHALGFHTQCYTGAFFSTTEESRWLENSYKGPNEHRVVAIETLSSMVCYASYCSVSELMGQHSVVQKGERCWSSFVIVTGSSTLPQSMIAVT